MVLAAPLQALDVREQNAFFLVEMENQLLAQLREMALDQCGFRVQGPCFDATRSAMACSRTSSLRAYA